MFVRWEEREKVTRWQGSACIWTERALALKRGKYAGFPYSTVSIAFRDPMAVPMAVSWRDCQSFRSPSNENFMLTSSFTHYLSLVADTLRAVMPIPRYPHQRLKHSRLFTGSRNYVSHHQYLYHMVNKKRKRLPVCSHDSEYLLSVPWRERSRHRPHCGEGKIYF